MTAADAVLVVVGVEVTRHGGHLRDALYDARRGLSLCDASAGKLK